MFRPEIGDKAAHPTLHAAGERAFDLLVATISEAHGLSALLIDRQFEDRVRTLRDAENLAARVTKLLQTGLQAP